MRKLLFTFVGLFLMLMAVSQQVPRQFVVVEAGTGFW
jgi:hypothetical protein